MAWSVHERISERLEAGRARTRGAERAETCGASAKKPRAVADEADERARGVSGRAGARRFRSISSDRANAAAARFGPTDRGAGPGCAGRPRREREEETRAGEGADGRAERKEKERWAGLRKGEEREVSAQGENNSEIDLIFYSKAEIDLNLI